MSRTVLTEDLIKQRNVRDSFRHLYLLVTHHMGELPEGPLKQNLRRILKEKKATERECAKKLEKASKTKKGRPVVYKLVQATGVENKKITTLEVQGPPYKSQEQILDDIVTEDVPLPSHLIPGDVNDLIIKAVAKKHGIPPWEIISRNRHRNIIKARFEVMYIMRTKAYRTFPQIGKTLGLDHTSVLHGYRRHKASLESEAA